MGRSILGDWLTDEERERKKEESLYGRDLEEFFHKGVMVIHLSQSVCRYCEGRHSGTWAIEWSYLLTRDCIGEENARKMIRWVSEVQADPQAGGLPRGRASLTARWELTNMACVVT